MSSLPESNASLPLASRPSIGISLWKTEFTPEDHAHLHCFWCIHWLVKSLRIGLRRSPPTRHSAPGRAPARGPVVRPVLDCPPFLLNRSRTRSHARAPLQCLRLLPSCLSAFSIQMTDLAFLYILSGPRWASCTLSGSNYGSFVSVEVALD